MIQSSHYANPPQQVHGPLLGFDFGWLGPYNYAIVLDEYRSTPTRPVIDGEARFEDLGIDNDAERVGVKGFWSGYDARNAAYHAVFSGAAGHTYGNHSVWQFYDPARNKPDPPARLDLPWQQALERPVSGQLQYLKQLMLSRPYYSRIPDPSLVLSDPGEGTAHVSATRDRNGSYAMIYLPVGQAVTLNLTLLSHSKLSGGWLDPRTGRTQPIPTPIVASARASFTPPSHGADQDWVLILDRK
jgi:hypothetical protein